MQKVITVNLNGNPYLLDEPGYEALRVYLLDAEKRLGTNPDKGEILRDLEESIADKLTRHLGPRRTVVLTSEVAEILREIGPVEDARGFAGAPPRGEESAATSSPHEIPKSSVAHEARPPAKRLYRIREGAIISGLCNGIAAQINVDPTIVRVLAVAFAALELSVRDMPPFLMVGIYLLLTIIVPYAKPVAGAAPTGSGIPDRVNNAVDKARSKLGLNEEHC